MDRPSPCDLKVLTALEEGIPLEERPWKALAARAGLSESEFIETAQRLLDSGAIRRLAVLFDSRAVGFATTLAAVRPKASCDTAAVELINSFDEVTHNYRRSGSQFEIWFTLTAAGRARIEEILTGLRESGLFERILELPAERVFKAHVRFGHFARGGGEVR